MCTALIIRIIKFIQRATTEVHTAYRVANKRMDTGVYGLFVAEILREMEILTRQHSLARNVVGIHTLPSSRYGTSVEYHLQSVVIGIAKNTFVVLHHNLFVTSKEIDLDTFDAGLLHPFHLLAALDGVAHDAAG